MAWLDDLLAQLQGGAQPPMFAPPPSASPFPDVKGPPTGEEIWAQIEAQNARDNAGADRRNVAGMTRAPIGGGPQFGDNPMSALAAAVPTTLQQPQPGADGSPFGMVPPSFALAKSMTANAPQSEPEPLPPGAIPPGEVPMPRARPVSTDLSAAARGGEAGPAPGPVGPPAAPPPAPMSIAAPPPAEPSFMSRLSEGAKGMAPAMLAAGAALQGDNSVAAAMMAKREAQALQAQQGNATARLLQSKGATAPEIQAAIAGGPETLKALLGQYMTKDKFSVVQSGEDKYGSKQYKVFNATDGTFKEVPAGSAAEAKAAVESQELEGVTGADRLAVLQAKDPAYARKVQSAVNGDISLPTGRAALTPSGKKFIEDVLGVDGTVSEGDFKVRQQVRKNYTSGKDFQVTKSINTVVDHGSQLEKAIKELGNYNYFSGIINPVRDKYLSQTDPKYIEAKHSYDVNAEGFAREMDFALSGGRPTVSGAEHQRKAFDQLAAQVGQQAALRKSIEMLDARLHEHQRGYEEALPPGTKEAIVPRLEKKTTDFISRIVGKSEPGTAAAPAAPVKPGNYVWKNGALVPE